MFQNLRPNSTLYILHRNGANPSLEYGQVVSVSPMRTVYKPANAGYPQPTMVVDVVVNIGGQNVNLQELPANQDIADDTRTGMLVSASRDEMNAEVITMKQKSEEVLRSVDYHRNFLAACDQMLSVLNPEIAAKQQQEKELADIKEQLARVLAMNENLMKRLGEKEETTLKPKQEKL